jgi:hypothetical protein
VLLFERDEIGKELFLPLSKGDVLLVADAASTKGRPEPHCEDQDAGADANVADQVVAVRQTGQGYG